MISGTAFINNAKVQNVTIKQWAGRGFWAVMDQGLFASSNFILNILLARWLTTTEYGAFAVAYTIFLLLGTFHTALITEPMLVFGSGKYKDCFFQYLRVLLRGHWMFTSIVGLIFAAAALVFALTSHNPLTPALFGLTIAGPFILFQWLMRRACYVNLQPQFAAYTGAVYMAVMLVGAYGLYHFTWLGAATALGIMAIASLVSGMWLVKRLITIQESRYSVTLQQNSRQDHWNYGKWALGTAMLTWIPGNINYLLLPIWGNLQDAGAYRALLNLFLPVMHITTALGGLLIPTFVNAIGSTKFSKLICRLLILFVITPTIYWLVLGLTAEPLIKFLYAGKYVQFSKLLWIAGLIPIIAAVVAVSGAVLRALELPNKVFIAYACSTATMLTIGVSLLIMLGVSGALIGWLLSYAVTGAVLLSMAVITQRKASKKYMK
ncbi:MAG: oligosaccharide flippase family protein [Desulfobacterales bacterium]|jgi:O-antigen/teichoic acid export membrane protein